MSVRFVLVVSEFLEDFAAGFDSHLFAANVTDEEDVTLELVSRLGLLLPELDADPDLEDDRDDGEKGLAVVKVDGFDVDRKFDDDNEVDDVEVADSIFLLAAVCSDELSEDKVTPEEGLLLDAPARPALSVGGLNVFPLIFFVLVVAVESRPPSLPSPAFPGSNLAFKS